MFLPRETHIFLSDRFLPVDFGQYARQLAILYRFVWNDVYGQYGTLKWVVEGRGLSGSKGSIAYFRNAREGS